jgi:hypothetical protein
MERWLENINSSPNGRFLPSCVSWARYGYKECHTSVQGTLDYGHSHSHMSLIRGDNAITILFSPRRGERRKLLRLQDPLSSMKLVVCNVAVDDGHPQSPLHTPPGDMDPHPVVEQGQQLAQIELTPLHAGLRVTAITREVRRVFRR